MTVPAVGNGITLQLETDPQSSTVMAQYRSVFPEVSAPTKHQVVKAIVNTVLGRGERTCTNVLFQPLHRIPLNYSSLLFASTVPLGAHVSEDRNLPLPRRAFSPSVQIVRSDKRKMLT